jgi:hypothetical protein
VIKIWAKDVNQVPTGFRLERDNLFYPGTVSPSHHKARKRLIDFSIPGEESVERKHEGIVFGARIDPMVPAPISSS